MTVPEIYTGVTGKKFVKIQLIFIKKLIQNLCIKIIRDGDGGEL